MSQQDIQSKELGGNMKIRLVGLLVTLLLAGLQVEARRALVVFKSNETFHHMTLAAQRLGNGFSLSRQNASIQEIYQSALGTKVKVEDSLDNIDSLVVELEDSGQLADLMNNPNIALVEEEIIHPLPQPFRGRVRPNFANLSATNENLVHTIMAGGFKQTDSTPWGILALNAIDAWPASKQGQGARVMVLDTGIDKDHPSVKANFEKGQDFAKDNQKPYPYADSIGHGTHVSGTIAGVADAKGFTGVAPKAKILMGRVCSTMGCSSVAVASGINWAIQEKVDLISMSLGGTSSTAGEKEAIKKAEQAGITVVAASGNSGESRVSYPAAISTVVAVGAVDSKLKKATFSQYGPELDVVAPGVDVVSSVPRGSGRDSKVEISVGTKKNVLKSVTFVGAKTLTAPEVSEVVNAGMGSASELTKAGAEGKYALIMRGGGVSIMDKIENAVKAKAKGILFVNNEPGLPHGSLADGDELPVAIFMIESTQGNQLITAFNKNEKVNGTFEVIKTDYSSYDGTSMATPHVSGVVALMKAANKKLSPANVREILAKTAKKLSPNSNNELASGIVNAKAAVAAATAGLQNNLK